MKVNPGNTLIAGRSSRRKLSGTTTTNLEFGQQDKASLLLPRQEMESLTQLANFGSGILLSAFTKRNQIESQEPKRIAAQWTLNVNHAMRGNLENESGPPSNGVFLCSWDRS
jgi:hypothetical protein